MPRRRAAALLPLLLLPLACGGNAPAPAGSTDAAVSTGEVATARGGATSASPAAAVADADSPPPAGSYRIVLERPTHVGAAYKRSVRVTDSRHEHLVEGKKTLRDVDHRVQITLVAAERVLAVDARGRWQKIELKTETFTAAGAKGDEPIVPPGTVLTIERAAADGEPAITSSAGELTPNARKALGLAVPSNTKTVGDDEIFGSRAPRAPGASWDVSREVAARDLGARGVQTTPALVEGNTRLVGTRDDRGTPCLEIMARMAVRITGFAGLPEGTRVERGAITAEMTGIVPVDVSAQAHRTSSRVGMELVATIPVGKATGTLTIESLSVRETVFESP